MNKQTKFDETMLKSIRKSAREEGFKTTPTKIEPVKKEISKDKYKYNNLEEAEELEYGYSIWDWI